MDLQIETELQGDLLLVTCAGTVTLDSAVSVFKEVIDLVAEKRVPKILINMLAVSGTLSTFDRYEFGSKIAEYLAELGIHSLSIACVGIPPTIDGFAARVAQNRDVDVDVFPTLEKAQDWLGRRQNSSP
jgi:hypothetical protein